MSKDDDYNSEAGEDLKKDFKNMFKHSRRAVQNFFRGGSRKKYSGINGWFPFFAGKNPLLYLCYPKLIVAGIILLTLLFCGVSIYGLIIILLLAVILILI